MPHSANAPVFRYRAVAPNGSVVHGRIEAADRSSAIAQLQQQGHVPITLEISAPASGLRGLLAREIGGPRRPGPRLIAELVGRLALLLEAGIALEAALALLATSEGATVAREQAATLLRRLRAGASLADAMAAAGNTFPPLIVAMVRAGEASGTLSPTLGRLATHLARAETVRQSVRSALVYPAVLIATAAGSFLLVLLVVLPQLEPIFADAKGEMPLLTRLAFGASTLLRQDWWVILIATAILALLAHRLLADPGMRARRDAVMLRLPVLGMALRRAEAGRLARVLGTLVGGGVALPAALVLAQPVLANRVVANEVAKVTAAVREGGGLAGPISRTGVFPDLAVQMIRIGEATGRLDAMLLRLADLLEADVQRTLDRALALLVPFLTIGLGAFVAAIIASVMLAVLSINDLVH
ncbi:type II secretion system protein F (GspF) [Rhizobiales bacterium GAS191]|nr:type II secretion system protein F (GspF) [Rhizobiales bacterium GAS113]SED86018.1 type II secretion system protein F (GspF) [Rhizobiales bacterium GAS191]